MIMITTKDIIWQMASIQDRQTITGPMPGGKNSWFEKCQEACRKDVEHSFGVLQARFAVVRILHLPGLKIRCGKP
jgi:hypothetical protein